MNNSARHLLPVVAVGLFLWAHAGTPMPHWPTPDEDSGPASSGIFDLSIPAAMRGAGAAADAKQLAANHEALRQLLAYDARQKPPRFVYVDHIFEAEQHLTDDTFPGHAGGKYPDLGPLMAKSFLSLGKTGDRITSDVLRQADNLFADTVSGFKKVK